MRAVLLNHNIVFYSLFSVLEVVIAVSGCIQVSVSDDGSATAAAASTVMIVSEEEEKDRTR